MYLESAWSIVENGGDLKSAGYGSATVRVRDPGDLDVVEKRIRAMGFQTKTMLARLQDMRRFFLAIQVLLSVVGTIALTIAALGIANTLLMAVLERFQEIGVCKAIGASDGDLFVLFLTEAAIIGLLGGLSGIALGWLMSWRPGGGGHGLCQPPGRHRTAGPLRLSALAFGRLAGLCDRGQRRGRHLSCPPCRAGRSDPRCGPIDGRRRSSPCGKVAGGEG